MDVLEKWFEESIKSLKVFVTADCDFIIYKGFKISKFFEGGYRIQDTRFNDFYSDVTKSDLLVLKDNGFIKGAKIIMHERDLKRIKIYEKKIEKLYSDKDKFKSLLSTNKTFYSKRINNCEEGIEATSNLLFLFKIREKQFKQE